MNTPTGAEVDVTTRQKIAGRLVNWGLSAVILLGLGVLLPPAFKGEWEQFKNSSQVVLTSILPLVATWVGTVLAFYFAKENFEAASRATKEILGRDQKLKSIPVKEAMIPLDKIDAFKVGTSVTWPAVGGVAAGSLSVPAVTDAISLVSASDFLTAKQRNRLPVFDASGAGVYVVHVSTLNRFLAAQARLKPTPPDPLTLTLGDLRTKDPESFKAILAWATVGENATLADAKHAMETTPHCIDVLVTKDGKSSGPVIGWLTNIEIGQRSQA